MVRRAIVVLDCTGEAFGAGLWVEGESSISIRGLTPRRALKELPEHIAYLLQNAGLKYTDIVAVGVSRGPGSFTGVRLGVTLAKTIAQVACCSIAAFDTLELIAHSHAASLNEVPGAIAVALDARRKEVYCGVFSPRSDNEPLLFRRMAWEPGSHEKWPEAPRPDGLFVEPLLETGVRSPEEFKESLDQIKELRVSVGPGFAAYPELLGPSYRGIVLSKQENSNLCLDSLCRLTLRSYQHETLMDALSLDPCYHRRADIQVAREEKKP